MLTWSPYTSPVMDLDGVCPRPPEYESLDKSAFDGNSRVLILRLLSGLSDH